MLILASASQSRKKLLENSDIKFIQIASNFDESKIREKDIQKLALELSISKAKDIFNKIKKENIRNIIDTFANIEIIACDSVFEFQGKAFGKPSNKKEAFDRWKNLSGSYGYLHTGHTLLFCKSTNDENIICLENEKREIISSKVYFSKLKDEEIIKYVETLEPLKCAGGFALEGKGGKYIERIEGCFSNVMGLSLPWVRQKLLNNKIYA